MTDAPAETANWPEADAPILISVIVVSFNTKRFLPRLLAALAAQTETRWRLVLVDNASAPGERPHLQDLPPGATLLQSQRNLGFAAANNLAAADLDTQYYALLNPDAFPEPDWLAQLLAAAARWPQAAAFGSTQIWDEAPALLDGAGDETHISGIPYRALYRRPSARNRPEGECFSACAAAMLVRARDFHLIGGFDERFYCYGEDVDLGYRLRLAGRASVQAAGAVVRHVSGGAAQVRSDFADYHGVRNRLWTFVKDTPPALFWLTAPLHALATLAGLAARCSSARGPASWRGLRDGLKGLGPVWRARRETQSRRVVGSWAIARAMIWSPWALPRRAPKRPRSAGQSP